MFCFLHSFFIFQTIPSTSKFVKSWRVPTLNVEHIFESVFWTVYYVIKKLDQLIDIVMGSIFRNNLHDLEDWVLDLGPFLFTNLPQTIKNSSWRVCNLAFEKVDQDDQK